MDWNNQEILITGGTGSLGKALTKYLLKHKQPKGIRVFSRDEYKHIQLKKELEDEGLESNISYLIGDVRDLIRLKVAMDGCTIVIHTAALKQVPLCETNPIEAIQTNIIGSQNIVLASLACKVEKVIGISTDKAVYPINLYGATKLAMEKLFIDGNVYSKVKKHIIGRDVLTGNQITNKVRYPRFSICRYGNVAGSKGSVIPVFKEQIKTGNIKITDQNMTRFWITMNKAVQFVIGAIEMMEGGEIFIPKMPSIKIYPDLVTAMFGTCVRWEVEFIGMRSGEKLHENLITVEERNHCLPSDCSTHFKIQKEQAVFSYPKLWDSSQNTFLLIKEIRKELKENDLM